MIRNFAPIAAGLLSCLAVAARGGDGDIACQAGHTAAAPILRPGYDGESGRDLANYPPHPFADFTHMRLELFIPDMNRIRLDGVQTLSFTPLGRPLDALPLDARGEQIRSVQLDGRECSFTHEDTRLTVRFDPPLEPGRSVNLVTRYTISEPMDGLYWYPESADWPGRPAQLHTQGQPQTISSLFPCHDFPNDRLTTELLVTVPAGYTVSSNGRLVSHEPRVIPLEPGGAGRIASYERFHWLQGRPHVPYLVSLIVGKFDVVDVGTRALPMPVYVLPGRGRDVKPTYGRTAEMIELFGRLFDEPYPWDRYAQLVVWNFAAGGMENTSATTMYDTAIVDKAGRIDTDLEGLISHELGHQWFGDLVTCNSWEHVWLNEGFATYLSALWQEHEHGPDAYQESILGNMDSVRGADAADAPARVGMASNIYGNPWEPFRRPANPYSKGSSILHMLRQRLGDDAFFRGVALYIDRRKLQTAETSDLRRALEDISGESLQQFFEQWCFRPGFPVLDVQIRWNPASSELEFTIKQTQNIDAWNPAFEFELPVWVDVPQPGRAGADRRGRWIRIPVTGRSASWAEALPSQPGLCAVDPAMSVLCDLKIDQPADRWISQLSNGPTLFSRVQAARSLATMEPGEGSRDLRRMAENRAERPAARAAAVRALKSRGEWEALGALLRSAADTPDIREVLCEVSAAAAAREDADPAFQEFVAETLDHRATDDPSSRVRAACIRGLATMKSERAWPVVITGLQAESQDDRVRQAAIDALATLDREEGLQLALRYARPGSLSRTRPVAIRVAASLSHHDPETTYAAICPILQDRETRARDAAGEALAALKDRRGLAVLAAFIQGCRDPQLRQKAEGWLADLRAGLPSEESPAPAESHSAR